MLSIFLESKKLLDKFFKICYNISMRKIICILALSLITSACITYKLERKLTPEVSEWYAWHKYIMDAPIPSWVGLPKKFKTEKDLFLRFSPEMQKEYIEKIFWKVRDSLAPDFEERKALVKEFLKRNHNELLEGVRARLLLQCGNPDFVYYITASQIIEERGELFPTQHMDIEGNVYQVWEYIDWQNGGKKVQFYFSWDGMNWRLAEGFNIDAVRLIEGRVTYFWPFEDDWVEIAEFARKALKLQLP
jgi:hypothetical protein